MAKDQLTFNDLPTVVGELCDRIASMENLLSENISRQNAPQENTHVPMTVQEACKYLRMPLSTFYYKVKKDNIPVIKQGKHLYIYRDELDKWLESSRKTPPAQSFEEENEALVASHRRKPNPKTGRRWKRQTTIRQHRRNWPSASRSRPCGQRTPASSRPPCCGWTAL